MAEGRHDKPTRGSDAFADELFERVLYGRELRPSLRAHLRECEDCRDLAERARQLAEIIESIPLLKQG